MARDKFEERSISSDLLSSKMKAVAMYSSSEEEDEKASNEKNIHEQGGGEKLQQQSTLSRRISVESQDFEFNKLGGGTLTSAHDMMDQQVNHEGGVQLASADELFYKGQLLPLQYNTIRPNSYVNSITSSPIISPNCQLHHDTIEIPSSKLSLRDQDVRFSSSCRMDHHVGLDSSLFTRSSSFRSHSSNSTSYYCNYYANYGPNYCINGFWDSSSTTTASTTSGGESTSSSRDSNGSSQDSYTSSDNNRDHHVCCHHHHGHVFAGVNGPFPTTCPKRKPGFMQSWKILFNGFRRGSHSADHQAANNPSFHGSRAAAVAAHPSPNQGSLAACGCKLISKDQKSCINEKHIRSPIISKTSLLWADEKEKGRRNYRGSRWQGYTRRIKPISMIKATLVGGHGHIMHAANNYDHKSQIRDHKIAAGKLNTEQLQGQSGEGWLHTGTAVTRRRQVPSILERTRVSQPSLVSLSGVKGTSKVSFRFHAVSSSCPASVRSSPNHSGLLAASPAAFNNNMSSMQELHSAVQGAIAHCKQSISSPSSM